MSAPSPVKHGLPHFQPYRVQDVALFAVGVMQKRQARRTVGVIFDGGNLRRDSGFVAPEVDFSILPLVAAAAVPAGDLTMSIPPARALARFDE